MNFELTDFSHSLILLVKKPAIVFEAVYCLSLHWCYQNKHVSEMCSSSRAHKQRI